MLALAGGVLALPLVALVARDILDHAERIDLGRNEIQGLSELSAYRDLLDAVPRHRELLLSARLAGPKAASLADILEDDEALRTLTVRIDGLVTAAAPPLTESTSVAAAWGALKDSAPSPSGLDGSSAHDRVLGAVLLEMGAIGERAGLIPSDTPQTYELARLMVYTIPTLVRSLDRVRAIRSIVQAAPGREAHRLALSQQFYAFAQMRQEMERRVEQVPADPGILAPLADALAPFDANTAALIAGGQPGVSLEGIDAHGEASLAALLALYDAIETALTRTLRDQVAGLEAARNFELAALALALGLIVLLLVSIGRRITRPIGIVTEMCRQLTAGRYDQPIDSSVGADMGQVVGALNDLKDRLAAERKTRKAAEQEREALRDQFVQSQKMEALGTLASGIAHDFNNIIAAIIGQAELAAFAAQMGKPIDDRIQRVVRAGIRAKSLVTQILSFSRQGTAEAKAVVPATMLRETMELAETGIANPATFAADIDEGVGTVMINPSQFYQLLMNILVNAGNAIADPPGTIACGLRSVRGPAGALPPWPVADGVLADADHELWIGEPLDKDYAHIWVADGGTGMDHDTLVRIFDPFFTTGPGSGLGLAAAQGIVLSADGAIHVATKPGSGSRFDILLPLHAANAAATTATAGPQASGARVLLVDDNEDGADALAAALEESGLSVDVHADPVHALAAFRKAPADYDILVTDHAMPGLTGLELITEARATRPGLPAILMTGRATADLRSKAEAAGLSAFLAKPFHAAVLGAAIQDAIGDAGSAEQ